MRGALIIPIRINHMPWEQLSFFDNDRSICTSMHSIRPTPDHSPSIVCSDRFAGTKEKTNFPPPSIPEDILRVTRRFRDIGIEVFSWSNNFEFGSMIHLGCGISRAYTLSLTARIGISHSRHLDWNVWRWHEASETSLASAELATFR